jgi:drug/metabolite transporter (DMT)-like permease
VVLWIRKQSFAAYASRYWYRGLIGGALSVTSYGVALWAMTRAPVAAVAALRETSVIFGALIGAWLLKEGHVARRVAGAATVAAGVVALRL